MDRGGWQGGGLPAATGNYGTVKVEDDRGVSWAGYAIRDDWVFMSSGATSAGIYNDTDNEWAIKITRNAQVSLYHDGTQRGYTYASAGVSLVTYWLRPTYTHTTQTSA